MHQLEKILTTSCDNCGCTEIRRTEKWRYEITDAWNERLDFCCGMSLRTSTTFSDVVMTVTQCQRPKKLKANEKSKFKKDIQQIIDYIESDEWIYYKEDCLTSHRETICEDRSRLRLVNKIKEIADYKAYAE